jgi:cytochrome c-type biogenesis protein CcmH
MKALDVAAMKKLSFALWTALLLTLALAATAFAQAGASDPIDDDQVNAVAKQLYCPVCENIPLDVCPTQACAEWRELIREKLAEGWNETQVKNYFVDQYGDRVLGAPPARGINWLIYVIPPLVILLGAFFLFRSMTLWQKRTRQALNTTANSVQTGLPATEVSSGNTVQDDVYIRQIEEELNKR